jgi:hypothetical protein
MTSAGRWLVTLHAHNFAWLVTGDYCLEESVRFARGVFITVLLLCCLETVRLWFMSPEVMAAHFDILGYPDRFVSRLVFFGYEARTLLVLILSGFVLQILPLILPAHWINMHNPEYWLSSERRSATVGRLSSFGAVLSTIILLVIQTGFELAVSANLQKPVVFGAQIMFPVIVGFIFLSLVTLYWLARSFRLPA